MRVSKVNGSLFKDEGSTPTYRLHVCSEMTGRVRARQFHYDGTEGDPFHHTTGNFRKSLN